MQLNNRPHFTIWDLARWGKQAQANAILKDIKDRGFVMIGDVYYPPGSAQAKSYSPPKKAKVKHFKSADIHDTRNIRNKETTTDPFVKLVSQELHLEVWPEFFFSTERQYRIDYAIPSKKIAIEVDGGIWMKGKSGHSSGTGIKRDMDKGNLLQTLGWKLIRRTPEELMTLQTLELIKSI